MKDTAQLISAIDATDITPFMVCEDLWRLLASYKSHMSRIADTFGLTTMQFGALHAIADQEQGNATMGKVAQRLHCDASNATGIIDRLTTLGLVVRQDNPQDRRVKSLVLTPEGSTTLQKILDQMPSAIGCDRLDDAEMQKLHCIARKLTDEPV